MQDCRSRESHLWGLVGALRKGCTSRDRACRSDRESMLMRLGCSIIVVAWNITLWSVRLPSEVTCVTSDERNDRLPDGASIGTRFKVGHVARGKLTGLVELDDADEVGGRRRKARCEPFHEC